MGVQADLFSEPVPAGPAAPDGFRYWPDLLSEGEQARVVRALQALSFKPYEHLGYLGNRRIAAFGQRYDQASQTLESAEHWPAFLQELLGQLTDWAGLPAQDFVQALVNEYQPGAGIGWHRDRPVYGRILGVSLLSPCTMRLRQKRGDGWTRAGAPLAPGSAYLLSGEVRQDWEHSITPMTALRYSITFRTLACPAP
ncbi:alpha-ketoglutarate-dependent dioxygenase AlkB [Brevundimonas kwangchunensis]|uniref:Alpha-ketoglutarate-dependent dioxygenase AlkB n=1 Tax=Brevundimonas kwangchunensis TaxID=322163 RepID=A0ABP3S3Y9_9CAUL